MSETEETKLTRLIKIVQLLNGSNAKEQVSHVSLEFNNSSTQSNVTQEGERLRIYTHIRGDCVGATGSIEDKDKLVDKLLEQLNGMLEDKINEWADLSEYGKSLLNTK